MSNSIDTTGFNERNVSHHFASADQEFSSCKQGMWLFLLTEVLLFSGLFVAYIVFRAWYPDMFDSASARLDWRLGATNTAILIASSLTMALAIRAAQQSKKGLSLILLLATLACAGGFLYVKSLEYGHKFHLGIFPGSYFDFGGEHISNEHLYFSIYYLMTGLHVVHVIIGALAILWVTIRTAKGDFYSAYYTPLEMVGLYWHLVDLIWIFLFPLLYLTK